MALMQLTYRVREAEVEGRGPQVRCSGCGDGPMARSTWTRTHAPYCAATIQARMQNEQTQLLALNAGPAQQHQPGEHAGEEGAQRDADEEMAEAGGADDQLEGGEAPAAAGDQLQHDGFEDDLGGYRGFDDAPCGEPLDGSHQEGQGQEGANGHEQLPAAGYELEGAGADEIETETEASDVESEEAGALEGALAEGDGGGSGGDGSGGASSGGDSSGEDEEEPGSETESEPEDSNYNQDDRYKRGSASWRWDHRAQPLWSGCHLTSLQATFLVMEWRRRHKLKTAAMDELFRMLADLLLPPDNLFPPSVYHARKLIGCAPALC